MFLNRKIINSYYLPAPSVLSVLFFAVFEILQSNTALKLIAIYCAGVVLLVKQETNHETVCLETFMQPVKLDDYICSKFWIVLLCIFFSKIFFISKHRVHKVP